MTDVPRHIAEHRLNVREGCSPVRQKKRGQAADRNQAIQEEVGKLVEAGIMKEKSDFHWTAEAEEAFKQMKQLIAELPMLAAPMEKEELIVYLAATKETVSAVLMTEREAKQMPIYFVSRALRGPEINYTSMEKLVLALVHASKRLKRPRVSVKGQILVDFIVERPEEDSPDTLMEAEKELPEPWILFTDRSSCTDGSGAGLILTNLEGIEFTYALRFRFDATNNEAEYEALIAELRIAEQMEHLPAASKRSQSDKSLEVKIKKSNALSKIASTSFAHLSKQVLVEELKEKSISEVEILAVVEEKGDTWMTSIFEYLTEESLLADVKKARAELYIVQRSVQSFVFDDHERCESLERNTATTLVADSESNKLIFSRKPKEEDDAVARKKNLMAKLSVGDVINCCVKKITYYGIFVEVTVSD
ncbi:reverse transcriptase domain-containing protein [Tanacetum coccineum]